MRSKKQIMFQMCPYCKQISLHSRTQSTHRSNQLNLSNQKSPIPKLIQIRQTQKLQFLRDSQHQRSKRSCKNTSNPKNHCQKMMRREEDPQIMVLQEISSMIIHILRIPPLITLPFPENYSREIPSSSSSQVRLNPWRVSPATFATLFLGISVALMLFGLILFVIGLILMPWVIGLVLIFYFAGVLSTLSGFGRAFLRWAVSPRDVPAWKYI